MNSHRPVPVFLKEDSISKENLDGVPVLSPFCFLEGGTGEGLEI